MQTKFILYICLIFSLASCGFKPMLAQNPQGQLILDQVHLSDVEGKDQPRLYRLISAEFQNSKDPLYQLNITVGEEISSIGVMKDGVSTRYKVKVTFNYNLVATETQNSIDSGSIFLYSSYDVPQSEFANYISERYTNDNLVKELCDELKSRLMLVISSRGEV